MHLQNIILSNKVRIGQHCCLFHNTTLGIKLGHDMKAQCPQIGDGVTICAGAVIVGPIKLNNGITVAANAVVTKSFEDEDIVIGGIPAKRISIHPEWSMLKIGGYYGRI